MQFRSTFLRGWFFCFVEKKQQQFITVMRKPRVGQHVYTVLIKHHQCPCVPKFVATTHSHARARSEYCPDVFTETCEKHANIASNIFGEFSNVYQVYITRGCLRYTQCHLCSQQITTMGHERQWYNLLYMGRNANT